MPSRSFSSVDLPAPFGPTKATRDSKSRPKSKSLYITGCELRQQSQFDEMAIFFCLQLPLRWGTSFNFNTFIFHVTIIFFFLSLWLLSWLWTRFAWWTNLALYSSFVSEYTTGNLARVAGARKGNEEGKIERARSEGKGKLAFPNPPSPFPFLAPAP